MKKISKGFTLVELLIVIAILAVLSTATVVVLNPAELLKQARDTQRVTDLSSIKTSLDTYIATVASPDLDASASLCGVAGTKGSAAVDPTTGTFNVAANIVDADRTVDGTGWVPVAFSGIPGGSPMAVLPIDPSNSGDLVYRYACSNTALTYELDAGLESAKYMTTLDLDGKDGGDEATFYEVGTDLTL